MRIVTGLGNPGVRYQCTWHNIGFLIIDAYLARRKKKPCDEFLGNTLARRVQIQGDSCLFVKPQLFMNLSGKALAPVLRKNHVMPEEMLVVHDDVDLALGRFQIKLGGGSGGHNGLKSIFLEWGTQDFYRLRVGVGRSAEGQGTADYILDSADEKQLGAVMEAGADALERIFALGPKKAMNIVNAKGFSGMGDEEE